MRLDYIFYIIAIINIIIGFFNNNSFSNGLGWACAILFAYGFYSKKGDNTQEMEK